MCGIVVVANRGVGLKVGFRVDGGVRGGVHPEGKSSKSGEPGVLMDSESSMVARAFMLGRRGKYPYLWERGVWSATLV